MQSLPNEKFNLHPIKEKRKHEEQDGKKKIKRIKKKEIITPETRYVPQRETWKNVNLVQGKES